MFSGFFTSIISVRYTYYIAVCYCTYLPSSVFTVVMAMVGVVGIYQIRHWLWGWEQESRLQRPCCTVYKGKLWEKKLWVSRKTDAGYKTTWCLYQSTGGKGHTLFFPRSRILLELSSSSCLQETQPYFLTPVLGSTRNCAFLYVFQP